MKRTEQIERSEYFHEYVGDPEAVPTAPGALSEENLHVVESMPDPSVR